MHNDHHEFPRSPRFGTTWWDLGGKLAGGLARLRLVTLHESNRSRQAELNAARAPDPRARAAWGDRPRRQSLVAAPPAIGCGHDEGRRRSAAGSGAGGRRRRTLLGRGPCAGRPTWPPVAAPAVAGRAAIGREWTGVGDGMAGPTGTGPGAAHRRSEAEEAMSTTSRWSPRQAAAAVRPSRSRAPGGPGDPPGRRRFVRRRPRRPFALEGGGVLREATLAYETWGELNDDALQRRAGLPRADRRRPRAADRRGPAIPPAAGGTTWSGRARRSTPSRYFLVCSNVLGGCQGTHRSGVARIPTTAAPTARASRSCRCGTWFGPSATWPTSWASTGG